MAVRRSVGEKRSRMTRALGLIVGGSLFLAANACVPSLAWSQPSAELQAIGKILSATGAVTVEHKDAVLVQANAPGGGNAQAKTGDLVYRGDMLRTGANGLVSLVFSDGTTFNISSNANMELNEFVYDPKGSANSTLISLKKGTFTFIAGAVAHTGDMKVTTPVGTMGIRGTAPHVEIMDDGTVKFSTLIEENKKDLTARSGEASPKSKSSGPERSALKDLDSCNAKGGVSADEQIAACTALIEKQIQTSQSKALAYNSRGIARAGKGDYDLALQDYDQSIKLYPTFAKAFNNRGVAYEKKGDLDHAISDFNIAINISHDYATAFANRAQVYEKRRDYDRALSDFNEAIRIQPTLGSLWNERCWIRAITGAAQDALADCNEAIRLGPASAPKFNSRGLAYLKLSQWESAIADFNAALQLNSGLARSLYGRGYAKLKAGDRAAGNADIAAATRAQRDIAGEFARYGLR
jgi:tetratricopeptide (TPR) repeat protein